MMVRSQTKAEAKTEGREDDDECGCCVCYDDVRKADFWRSDFCGLDVCKTCAVNEEGETHCGNFDCKKQKEEEEGSSDDEERAWCFRCHKHICMEHSGGD